MCPATARRSRRRRRSPGRRRCRRAHAESCRLVARLPCQVRTDLRADPGLARTGGRAGGGMPRTSRDARRPARLAAAGGAPARRRPRDAGGGRPARAPPGRHAGRAQGAGRGKEPPPAGAARGRGAGDQAAIRARATLGGQVPAGLAGARRRGRGCPRQSLLHDRPREAHRAPAPAPQPARRPIAPGRPARAPRLRSSPNTGARPRPSPRSNGISPRSGPASTS